MHHVLQGNAQLQRLPRCKPSQQSCTLHVGSRALGHRARPLSLPRLQVQGLDMQYRQQQQQQQQHEQLLAAQLAALQQQQQQQQMPQAFHPQADFSHPWQTHQQQQPPVSPYGTEAASLYNPLAGTYPGQVRPDLVEEL